MCKVNIINKDIKILDYVKSLGFLNILVNIIYFYCHVMTAYSQQHQQQRQYRRAASLSSVTGHITTARNIYWRKRISIVIMI